ncbi:MAG: hypothetical protein RJA53_703 [Bacteroidota bacterium]|jgi:hypothetical protein
MDQYSNHIISGDTQQNTVVLNQLFEDNVREVPLDKLRLPKSLPSFKLRDILTIADKIESEVIDDILLVNEDFMIVKGLKRFYALKRLGRTRVRVCIGCNKRSVADELFSIRK